MRNRFITKPVIVLAALFAFVVPGQAQKSARKSSKKTVLKVSGPSATTVSAQVLKGRLSPTASKPGDDVILQLTEDLKSNGELVLRKGSTITGIVRKVSRTVENTSSNKSSMMAIEWFIPAAQGRSSHQVLLAVQSLSQSPRASVTQISAQPRDVAAGTESANPSLATLTAGADAKTNSAILRMPTVVPTDAETTMSVQKALGITAGQQLYQTGQGTTVTAAGVREALSFYSHFNNDTVLAGKDFEITGGAQVQLLVGVRKN